MVHVYIRPMLPFGAWTSLKRPIPGASSSPAFYPVATVLHVVSDGAALQCGTQEAHTGTADHLIALSPDDWLAKAFYKNAVQSPPVRLTPSLKAIVVEALWQESG